MSYAPASLLSLAAYFIAHNTAPLGIVGDASHTATGTSYHLGKDHLIPGAYSAILPRDKAGLSNAASAIDVGRVGGSLTGLQAFSRWLVAECMAGWPAGPCVDLREVIYSPDGKTVWRWDAVNNQHATGPGQGDDSHLTHTHISYYRDSEGRDKLAAIAPYFEGTASDVDPKVDIPVAVCDVAAGGTVYADAAKSAVLIPVWAGAKGVGVYAEGGTLVPVRLNLGSSTTPNLKVGWVGSDKVSNVRLPGPSTPPSMDCTAAIAADRLKAKIVYS